MSDITRIPRKLLPAQEELLSDHVHSEFLLKGPTRTGKSEGLSVDCVTWCKTHPGTRAALFRRIKADLDTTLMYNFKKAFFGNDTITWTNDNGENVTEPITMELFSQLHPDFQTWVPKEQKLVMKNGSTIRFGYLRRATGAIATSTLSSGLSYIGVCQAEELERNDFDTLRTRLSEAKHTRFVMDCNPDAKDHPLYMDFALDGISPLPPFRRAIDFPLHDNLPNLSQDFVQSIKEIERYNPAYYRKMILGEWGVLFEGQVFGMFLDRDISESGNRCEMPSLEDAWLVVGGLDYGFDHEAAFTIWAKLKNGKTVKVYQICKDRMTPSEIIARMDAAVEQWKPIIYHPRDNKTLTAHIQEMRPDWDIRAAETQHNTKPSGITYMQEGYAKRRLLWADTLRTENIFKYVYTGNSKGDTKQAGSNENDADRMALYSSRRDERYEDVETKENPMTREEVNRMVWEEQRKRMMQSIFKNPFGPRETEPSDLELLFAND